MSEGEGNVHSVERDTAQTPSSNDTPLIHSYRYRHKKKCVHVYKYIIVTIMHPVDKISSRNNAGL